MSYNNNTQEITEETERAYLNPDNYRFFMSEPVCHCTECDTELYFNEDGYKITDISDIDESSVFCSEECCLRYIREYTRDNCIKQVIL